MDEVQEQAEELLKDMSLASYYDEVAMPGLELAARDLARGVLTRAQMERIKDTVIALITELEDHEDAGSEPAIDAETPANEDSQDVAKEAPAAEQRYVAQKPPEGKARRGSAVFPVALRWTKCLPLCLLNFCEKKARLLKLRCRIPCRAKESRDLNAIASP